VLVAVFIAVFVVPVFIATSADAVWLFVRMWASVVVVIVRRAVAIPFCRAILPATSCSDARCEVSATGLNRLGMVNHQMPRLNLRTGELYVTSQ
jgi:hypothetical protein